MKIKSILLFLSIFFFNSCIPSNELVSSNALDLENNFFDVVSKELKYEAEVPLKFSTILEEWFQKNVKVNGFEGSMKFIVKKYSEETQNIENGKKVNIYLNYFILIEKPSISYEKKIDGDVSSFGSISGTFSINDFEKIISNAQLDIINRLSNDLRSKY